MMVGGQVAAMRPAAIGCRQPLEAGNGKGNEFSPRASSTYTLGHNFDCSLIRPILDL